MRHYTHTEDFLSGSPLTFDATGGMFHVAEDASNPHTEPVSFQVSGTWNSATVTLHQCVDHTASPLVFVATALAYTADTAGTWTLPTDTVFKLVVSGHGSPVPSLTATFKGDVRRF